MKLYSSTLAAEGEIHLERDVHFVASSQFTDIIIT